MTRGTCRGNSHFGGRENRPKCPCLTTFEPAPEDRFGGCVHGARAIPFRDGEVGEFADAPRREQIRRREPVDRSRGGKQPATYILVARKGVSKDGDGEAQLAKRARVFHGDRLTRRVDDHVQHIGDVAQSQRARMPITQPLLQLVPIHRTSFRRYSAVTPRDNHPPVAAPTPRAIRHLFGELQNTVNR